MPKKKLKNSIRYPIQERSRATVDVILQATAQILEKEGNAAVSTNAIAKKAGVSIGGLYQYFEDREDILRELCIRERQKDFEALQSVLAEKEDADMESVIRSLLQASLARFSDRPNLRRVLNSEVSLRGKSQQYRLIRQQLTGILVARLQELGFRNMPPDIESRLEVLVGGFEGAYYAALEVYGKNLERDEFVDDAIGMVMAFLKKLR